MKNKDGKEGGRGERMRSQRQSLNKADLLFPPGVQQPALFPSSLHLLFIPLFLFFLLHPPVLKSQIYKCYKASTALEELDFLHVQVLNSLSDWAVAAVFF